jgi:uncharacterized repeat protein (TIGR01451 family)
MKRKILKTLLGIIPIAALVAVLFTPFGIKSSTSAWPCYEPNIVFCGSNSTSELAAQVAAGDGRNTDIKSIFGRIGIYSNDIRSPRMVEGEIRRDGSVWVGGTRVASNALNGQRGTYGINGPSTPWAGLYWTTPNANFKPGVVSLSAWVYMYNGQFKYGIIKACGNPILITPTQIPPSLTIQKDVWTTSSPVYRDINTARAGDTLKYKIAIRNNSAVTTEETRFWDTLPPNYVTVIPGTGRAKYGDAPGDTYTMSDASITGGYGLRDLPPEQVVFVTFEARLNRDITQAACQNIVNRGYTQALYVPTISDTAVVSCSVTPLTPTLLIQKDVRNESSQNPQWEDSDTADEGNTLMYRVKVHNNSAEVANNVTIWDVLPPHVTLGRLESGAVAEVDKESGTLQFNEEQLRNGMNIGTLTAGEFAYMYFKVVVNDDFTEDGCTPLVNLGLARADNVGEISDNATTTVCNDIPGRCTVTVNKYNDLNGDAIRQENEPLLPNWKFTLKGTALEDTRTTNSGGVITFAGLEEGQYSITEEMQSGWRSTTGTSQITTICPDKTLWFGNQQVSPPPPVVPGQPTSLPVSGPVEAAGGIMGTGALGYAGYMWRKSRKTLTDTLKRQ